MTPRKKTGTFVESGIDGEWILMNIDTGHFHSISNVAPAIWRAIDGQRTLADIQAMMAARHAVDRTTCDRDVAKFIDDLRTAGFVDVA